MVILLLIVLGCLIVTTLLFLLLKRSPFSLSVDVGGVIFNGVVAVYSIFLAFVVVLVWQQYQNTDDRIQQEASKAFNLYRSSYAFGDVNGQRVRQSLHDYIQSVVKDEWPAMEHDSTSSSITRREYREIWDAIDSIKPVTESEKIWYASLVANINLLGEARTLRVSDVESSVPGLMWAILITGAVITLGFASLLDSKGRATHLLKVLLFSLLLIFNGILIYLLDHPYKGIMKIKPAAYEKIIHDYKGSKVK